MNDSTNYDFIQYKKQHQKIENQQLKPINIIFYSPCIFGVKKT